MNSDLTVIILTYNEEANIAQALDSVCGWAKQVFILDSLSTDQTVKIAEDYDCKIFQNPFENYAKQRNHALEQLPIDTEWVFFLDADEWIPDDLKEEISQIIASNPDENGFYIKRRFIWMGQWIRRGYYPTFILRLFRKGKARCEERAVNEHLIVDGETGSLKCDFIHEDRKGVTDWIAKHNRFSTFEALELFKSYEKKELIEIRFWGTQAERKRWLRFRVWNRLPPLIRPFIYFFYRYIVSGGFLDGYSAFTYHFLQGLWYRFLIDVKYMELKMQQKKK